LSGHCVEIRTSSPETLIRDSKQSDLTDHRPVIGLPTDRFDVFQDELIGLAPEGSNGEIAIDRLDDGWVAFRSLRTGVTLRFDADELTAFVEGVRAGEFRPALTTA
jgi:hypothetical protein